VYCRYTTARVCCLCPSDLSGLSVQGLQAARAGLHPAAGRQTYPLEVGVLALGFGKIVVSAEKLPGTANN